MTRIVFFPKAGYQYNHRFIFVHTHIAKWAWAKNVLLPQICVTLEIDKPSVLPLAFKFWPLPMSGSTRSHADFEVTFRGALSMEECSKIRTLLEGTGEATGATWQWRGRCSEDEMKHSKYNACFGQVWWMQWTLNWKAAYFHDQLFND